MDATHYNTQDEYKRDFAEPPTDALELLVFEVVEPEHERERFDGVTKCHDRVGDSVTSGCRRVVNQRRDASLAMLPLLLFGGNDMLPSVILSEVQTELR